ncbi:DUF3016 domain-containing protein [Alteromonas gilva]|uniref:DUF3016 domain-containing protein n=1 Tax=Alteromonas gilva TaxID=2987522 RepID=A0ABT5KZ96_9ALTE|nr:DUF3016 domain-containing protein [Alteromonas gilva]MDC8829963.1 DUF3016 domain-containing protein [Alteromonas gilva]
MQKLATKWFVIPALACLSGWVYAEDNSSKEQPLVEITWQEPESYTDVKPGNESRKRFRERVFKELDEYFNKLAEQLPEGQTLNVTVTNLDLAGQVWPTFGMGARDIRIIESMFIPRMAFSYELKEGGQVMKSAEVSIKDMSFMNSTARFRTNEPFAYEKFMIKRWFNQEFDSALASS